MGLCFSVGNFENHASNSGMNAYRNASYAGFVLYFIGIVLFIYGFANLSIELDLDEKGLKATGEVYDLEVTEPYRQAWVVFQTQDGKTVRFMDKLFWNQDFEKYTVGQKVEVLYDPANPNQTAVIDDFFQRTTAPWWPVIVGSIIILVGYVMRKVMLRKAAAFDRSR
ncbi:DUF3592 domain-containing protein [Leptospira sp. GIMC2001]|uniref:DUF3592 domain-containing protein n=1 Tax=Leptospira sp. GIMC2001 TaxID=1513297 RepID=UPI002349471E|nr:DUF3592 domain-containing protein [Leptospira sp. GIMC2001]WCL49631.1 DUF3592 domain-containing protein [Leptospira sp. GIMC2001]